MIDLEAGRIAEQAEKPEAMVRPLVAFSEGFSASKGVQWRAFLKRSAIDDAPDAFEEVVDVIRGFVEPVLASVQEGTDFAARWDPPGPWAPVGPVA